MEETIKNLVACYNNLKTIYNLNIRCTPLSCEDELYKSHIKDIKSRIGICEQKLEKLTKDKSIIEDIRVFRQKRCRDKRAIRQILDGYIKENIKFTDGSKPVVKDITTYLSHFLTDDKKYKNNHILAMLIIVDEIRFIYQKFCFYTTMKRLPLVIDTDIDTFLSERDPRYFPAIIDCLTKHSFTTDNILLRLRKIWEEKDFNPEKAFLFFQMRPDGFFIEIN
jgi:hypothetical protein